MSYQFTNITTEPLIKLKRICRLFYFPTHKVGTFLTRGTKVSLNEEKKSVMGDLYQRMGGIWCEMRYRHD